MNESQRLLAEYVRSGSESAFRRLVELYSALVYSTALRRADGDAHRAMDIAQTVFIDLARMAGKLSKNSMLGGWLHRHTCFVASTLIRGERRRQAREQQAFAMNTLTPNDESHFTAIASDLDEAIQRLGPDDRDVILLRYFECQNLRNVGEALGVSENVAQKRVARALSELRIMLGARGTAIPVAALGTILAAKAVAAVPVGLAASLSGAALAGTTGVPSASLSGSAMTGKFKSALVGTFLFIVLTLSLYLFKPRQPVAEIIVPPVTEAEKTPLKFKPGRAARHLSPITKAISATSPLPTVASQPSPPTRLLPQPAPPQPKAPGVRYRGQMKSRIRIEGDSTAHKWTMEGSLIGGVVEIEGVQIDTAQESMAGAEDGLLKAKVNAFIPVRSVKSGHDIMDRLYQKALRENEHPRILYNLDEMKLKPDHQPGTPFELDTQGAISIAGITNRITMAVKLENLAGGILKFTGSVPLKMSDFEITPPSPNIGAGLLKCADEITVSFEWLLRVDENQPQVTVGVPLGETNVFSQSQAKLRNLTLGKITTSSDKNASRDRLAKITDGNKSFTDENVVLLRKGMQWVQLDLGGECQVSSIALWHAYDTHKTYHDVIIQAADDPDMIKNVRTLFNNDHDNSSGLGIGTDLEYPESAEGKTITVNGLPTRYLRFYSRGSTDSSMNEYTEIEVLGQNRR